MKPQIHAQLPIVNTNIHHRLEIPVASENVFLKNITNMLIMHQKMEIFLTKTIHHTYSQLLFTNNQLRITAFKESNCKIVYESLG